MGSKEKEEFVLNTLKNFDQEPNFTMKELKDAISILKKNKAAGVDRIPAEITDGDIENNEQSQKHL